MPSPTSLARRAYTPSWPVIERTTSSESSRMNSSAITTTATTRQRRSSLAWSILADGYSEISSAAGRASGRSSDAKR